MGRLLALDGVRGLLALYILAGHTLPFILLPRDLIWLGSLAGHGRAAVELFFVLSGLAISRSCDSLAGRSHPAASFLGARLGRLLPVYVLTLLLAMAVLSLGNPYPAMPWLPPAGAAHDIMETSWPPLPVWHALAHLFLLQGLLPPALLPHAEFSLLGPAWSLSTEWQFYLLAALALAVRGPRVMADGGRLGWVIALLLLGAAGFADAALPPGWRFGRAFLPFEAWYFALGIESDRLLRRPDRRAPFVAVLAVTCLLGGAATYPAAMLVPLAWSLCLACERPDLAPRLAPLWRAGYRLLTLRPLLWCGAISYPLYLVHAPLQRLLMLWLAPFADGDWRRFTLIWVAPALLLPLLAAALLHASVEEPWRRRSRHWALGAAALRPRPQLSGSGSNTSAAGRP